VCLTYTGLLVELEHLKIKTTLIDEMFASDSVVVYYESTKNMSVGTKDPWVLQHRPGQYQTRGHKQELTWDVSCRRDSDFWARLMTGLDATCSMLTFSLKS
jgi:hypothetical protein